MNRTVCITGASSGFGEATAWVFAAHGYDLILTGRRKNKLEEVKSQILTKYPIKITVLELDVQNRAAVFTAFESLEPNTIISVLVNNAGLALGRELFNEADIDDWETMLDTNVKGILYVTRAALPLMERSAQPHIINIGSTAGKEVYEKGNVYCASKHAVDAISQAMRIDLLAKGIKVTAINPGAADTEFSNVRFKGDAELAAAVYKGYQPLQAKDVAEIIYYATTLPAHVCINDMTVTCLSQANSFYTVKKS